MLDHTKFLKAYRRDSGEASKPADSHKSHKPLLLHNMLLIWTYQFQEVDTTARIFLSVHVPVL